MGTGRTSVRFWLAALALVVVTGWTAAAFARPVRVRGGSSLLAQASFVRGRTVLELRGQLTDDGRQPLEDAWLELATDSGLDLAEARACAEPRVKVAPMSTGLRVKTAAGGEFCLRWPDAPDQGDLDLRFGGDPFHAATHLTVDFDRTAAQRLTTTLRFEPRPMVVDLDEDQLVISGVLDLALDTVHAPRRDLEVILEDERGKKVAEARTAGDGKVRLLVDPLALAGPGSGKLKLRFDGNDRLEPAYDTQPVTRRTAVRMRLANEVEPASAGDTATIALELNTRRGPVDGGVVEALLAGSSVGSAAVKDGRASLVVLLRPEEKDAAVLSVRYLPSSPFYTADSVLSVEVPIAPPSIALRMLLVLVVVVTAGWVTVSWRRAKHPPKPREDDTPALPPGVHVVDERPADEPKWDGVVVDAHGVTPIAGATVRVHAPTLDGDGVVLEVQTDARGRFAFELDARPDAAEIAAEGELHSEQRKPLPAPGTLRVALMTRRRSLIRRFVKWARYGAFDVTPEPTPAQVRRAAQQRQREDVEQWAGDVEQAAFGPNPVDRHVEARIRDGEPRTP